MTRVLVFDVGTSKIKAGLYEENGEKIAESVRDSELIFPREGWAEQDPLKWIRVIEDITKRMLTDEIKIEGIGITGQMIGLVPVDSSLNPLGNAIVWLDSRANREAEEILSHIPLFDFLQITGGIPSGKDVVSKILWMKNNDENRFNRTRYFLDVKDFIISRLTGEIITDISTASVRGLVDIRKKDYSDEILSIIGIDRDRLPPIDDALKIAGNAGKKFSEAYVINGSGDAFVTPFGAGAVSENKVHYYLGTSGWASTHVKDYKINEERGIGSVLSVIPDKWLFISESESAGSCLDWYMQNFGYLEDYGTVDEEAMESEPGAKNIIFLPWLYGERSPILDVYARGAFINLSLAHKRSDITRAVLEGIAMNTRWMLNGIEESGVNFEEINTVGGGAKSDVWMQIFADVTGKRINRMEDPQNATLRGAALISLLSLGNIKSYEETEKFVNIQRIFEPGEVREIYDEIFENFKNSYESLKGIFENLNIEKGD